MSEQLQAVDVGIHPADAEQVEFALVAGNLMLTFIDWREVFRRYEFKYVLGLRWQEFDLDNDRDDMTYQVVDSGWLQSQAKLQAESLTDFQHLKICFNAVGMLDVLCKAVVKHA